MLYFKNQKILIIAPHPDDEIYGAGGLIYRAKNEGAKIYILYLTVGTTKDFSKKGVSTAEERIKEIKKVAQFLNFDGYKIAFPGNEYHLKLDSIPQKDLINEIERGTDISIEKIMPQCVLLPRNDDYNQDHRAVHDAAISAARPTVSLHKHFVPLIVHYELPYTAWSMKGNEPKPNAFLPLSENDLEVKIRALKLYRSQMKGSDGPLSPHGVKTLAQFRGLEAGTAYAEAFTIKRFVL